jgi:hypothetical protein
MSNVRHVTYGSGLRIRPLDFCCTKGTYLPEYTVLNIAEEMNFNLEVYETDIYTYTENPWRRHYYYYYYYYYY